MWTHDWNCSQWLLQWLEKCITARGSLLVHRNGRKSPQTWFETKDIKSVQTSQCKCDWAQPPVLFHRKSWPVRGSADKQETESWWFGFLPLCAFNWLWICHVSASGLDHAECSLRREKLLSSIKLVEEGSRVWKSNFTKPLKKPCFWVPI